MLIFLKENLVFFATPKTASTSVEIVLGDLCDIKLSRNPQAKHTPYRKYKRLLEPYVLTLTKDKPECLSVYREPVDWLGSWYRYRRRPELVGKANSTHDISFDQFVEAYLQESQPAFANVGSQARFVSDKDGTLGMTRLFRYDQLDGLVGFLEKRLKKQIKLPRTNVSPKEPLSLSPGLLKELQCAHARDFEIYDSIET
ncbi:MAG: gamma-glutamyl kinase [Rhodobacterales bacterium]